MRMREGWEPCRSEDYPEMHVRSDLRSDFKGCIEIGGLLLCRMPQERYDARDAYYRRLAEQQLASVEANYLRENDPRMPLLKPEGRTQVIFGKR